MAYGRMSDELLKKLDKMKLLKDLSYVDNYPLLTLAGIAVRAGSGTLLNEHFGSTRQFHDFNQIMFVPSMFPTPEGSPVDLSVTIGKHSSRPLKLTAPFMLSAYGYGVSVSKQTKIALAKASMMADTAVNSGEGGFLEEERQNARRYVVQYNKACWGNSPEQLRRCDMIEIRVSQGSSMTLGFTRKSKVIDEDLRRHFGVGPGESAVMPDRFPGVDSVQDLNTLTTRLRDTTDGLPIALKIAAGDIERDLSSAIECGVDAVTLDGAQGGTYESPQMTIDNFGIPTLHAIVRARRFLDKNDPGRRISLLVSGGIRDAGDIMKAVALGADAAYIGSAALWAMVYPQIDKVEDDKEPFEMVFQTGTMKQLLDVDMAAESVANFLKATGEEVNIAVRCMGKTSVSQVGRQDLVALTPEMVRVTGLRPSFE